MKRSIIFLFVLLIFLFNGCANLVRETGNWGNKKPALETYKVGKNDSYNLDYLFTIPGTEVKIYRVIDMAHTRYVAVAPDMVSVTSTTSKKEGKTTTYNDSTIVTIKE